MAHIVLLGDSVFDNAAYVRGALSVSEHLRRELSPGSTVTLLAADGSTTSDVHHQIPAIPSTATHSVLSAGGNDAYNASPVLRKKVGSVTEAVELLADAQAKFRFDYERLLAAMSQVDSPAAVCTIYDSIPDIGEVTRTALAVFNDVILRAAFHFRLPVIDLRLVCDEPGDYSDVSPIEPSEDGGAKIAGAIARLAISGGAAHSSIYG